MFCYWLATSKHGITRRINNPICFLCNTGQNFNSEVSFNFVVLVKLFFFFALMNIEYHSDSKISVILSVKFIYTSSLVGNILPHAWQTSHYLSGQ